ncbi:MAG: DNA polymerase domain-containing protein, partial [Candidatus Bathyarchaeia archaeon]
IGGKHRQVEPPFQPYCYSLRPVQGAKPVQKKLLSDMKLHTVYRMDFEDEGMLKRCQCAYTIEDRFPFKMRVAIDVGYKFPSSFPKVLAWDIETKLAGLNPNPMKDEVVSIATWGEKEEDRHFFYGDRRKFIPEFLAFWRENNPDVPADFYGRFYDYICLINNCHELGLTCSLGRDGSEPYILKKEFEKQGKGRIEHTVLIRGRVPFDVHKEVDADYTLTLSGLKTRGLKETARHYGMNPIEIDYDHMKDLVLEELKAYNLSDAEITYNVVLIYLQVLWILAEYLDIPLDMVVQRAPSHMSNIVLGRALAAENIVSDGANCERFPQFFVPGRKAFQGAEPRCFRSGVYTKNVKHKDFKSMYVSINRALNLSPETVSLVAIYPYTGKYRFEPHKDFCIVEVPDEINGQVVIKIDLSKKGVMRQVLDDITEKRSVSKEHWKQTGDPKFNSEQIAYKLVGNLFFGYNGMKFANYGNVLIAILDTAIPRLLIDSSMAKEESVGNLLLNVDTDGYFYVENKPVCFKASDLLPECFETALIEQETEDVQGMIILEDIKGNPAAKSYILKDDKGKITKHGSSVLSRGISVIVDHFVDDLAQTLFDGGDAIATVRKWNAKKISCYPAKDFVQYTTLSKRPEDYDKTTMYSHLISQLKTMGAPVQWGDKVNYYVCKSGYVPTLCFDGKHHKIDASEYQEKMASIASRILQLPYKQILSYMKGDTLLTSYQNNEES